MDFTTRIVELIRSSNFDGPALAFLRSKFAPAKEPACRVCGGEMAISSTEASRVVWRCASPEADWLRGPGPQDEAETHWHRSLVETHGHADAAVVALIDEFRALHRAAGHNVDIRVGDRYYPHGHENGRCHTFYAYSPEGTWDMGFDADYAHDPAHRPETPTG